MNTNRIEFDSEKVSFDAEISVGITKRVLRHMNEYAARWEISRQQLNNVIFLKGIQVIQSEMRKRL